MSIERSESGENATEWARVSTLEVPGVGLPHGQKGRRLAVNREDWKARAICGGGIYQFALITLREKGRDTRGNRIDSRGAAELEFEAAAGETEKTGNRSQ